MRDRLGSAFDSPDSKSRYVRRLFSTIADRYDLITVLLSYGNDRRWKRRLVAMARASAWRSARSTSRAAPATLPTRLQDAGARTVGLDITPRMVELARAKRSSATPAFLVGDMMALPFADATFDVVTTGYGIRNVPVIDRALAEIARVLRPGGVLLSLDFDRPPNAFVRAHLSELPDGRRFHRSGSRCTAIPTPTATFPSRSDAIRAPPAVCPSRRPRDSAACDAVPASSAASWPSTARSNSTPFHTSAVGKNPCNSSTILLPSMGSRFPMLSSVAASPAAVQPMVDESAERNVPARQLIKAKRSS